MKKIFYSAMLMLTSVVAYANPSTVMTNNQNLIKVEQFIKFDKIEATCTITFTIRNSIGMYL